jgi:hypothetical protein
MAKNQKPPAKKTPPKQTTEEENEEEGEETEETEDEDADRKINAIVTNRVNRALKPLTKTIESLTAKLEEMTKAKSTSSEEETDEEIEEEPSKPVKGKGKPNKQLTALEKRVKDAEERAAAAEKAQTEAAEKAQRQEENVAIGAALAKSGISDQRVIRAVTLSLREDGLIIRDEETGKIKFKTVDKHGYEDLVEPEVGLGKWLKGDGKSFLPAVPAGGSGAGNTNLQTPRGAGMNKQEISKLSAREKAAIDLERASTGLPPLES